MKEQPGQTVARDGPVGFVAAEYLSLRGGTKLWALLGMLTLKTG